MYNIWRQPINAGFVEEHFPPGVEAESAATSNHRRPHWFMSILVSQSKQANPNPEKEAQISVH